MAKKNLQQRIIKPQRSFSNHWGWEILNNDNVKKRKKLQVLKQAKILEHKTTRSKRQNKKIRQLLKTSQVTVVNTKRFKFFESKWCQSRNLTN